MYTVTFHYFHNSTKRMRVTIITTIERKKQTASRVNSLPRFKTLPLSSSLAPGEVHVLAAEKERPSVLQKLRQNGKLELLSVSSLL